MSPHQGMTSIPTAQPIRPTPVLALVTWVFFSCSASHASCSACGLARAAAPSGSL